MPHSLSQQYCSSCVRMGLMVGSRPLRRGEGGPGAPPSIYEHCARNLRVFSCSRKRVDLGRGCIMQDLLGPRVVDFEVPFFMYMLCTIIETFSLEPFNKKTLKPCQITLHTEQRNGAYILANSLRVSKMNCYNSSYTFMVHGLRIRLLASGISISEETA
jgi:hypothetical protein